MPQDTHHIAMIRLLPHRTSSNHLQPVIDSIAATMQLPTEVLLARWHAGAIDLLAIAVPGDADGVAVLPIPKQP